MQPKARAKKVQRLVRTLARFHIDDANAVLDQLEPSQRKHITALLAARGDTRWNIPTQDAKVIVEAKPNVARSQIKPAWFAKRVGEGEDARFFKISAAALNALKEADANVHSGRKSASNP